jgi:hypothetical protein
MLLAADLHKDFIDQEGVTIASMFFLHAADVQTTEFDAPKTNASTADSDTSFSEEVFDIPMAQIESVVEPDCVVDDVGRESVPLVSIHRPTLTI